MTAFNEAWDFLKADESYTGRPKFGGNQKQPLDMHEYPPGSGRFMSLQQMIEARNADARKNMERMDTNMNMYRNRRPNVGGQPSTNAIAGKQQRDNIMVSPTGNLSDIPEEQRWNPL